MITVYGIKNCDTMKKAFDWLNKNGIEYEFHDYKKSGIEQVQLQKWLTHFDMWQLINTRGATWRQLPDEQKANIRTQKDAIDLMIEKTSLIKRPLVTLANSYLLGFNAEEWSNNEQLSVSSQQ